MVSRGRSWDERTGSVVAARDAGMELFFANVPLSYCDNAQNQTGEKVQIGPGQFIEVESCDMACCVDKIGWVQTDGGLKLAYRICGEWVLAAVVDANSLSFACGDDVITPELIPDIPGPGPGPDLPPDPETANVDCQIAAYIVDVLWLILETAYDKRDNLFFYSAMANEYPTLSWRFATTTAAQGIWLAAYVAGGDFSEHFTADDKQNLKCQWESAISGSGGYEITSPDWNRMGLAAYAAMGADEATCLNAIMAALGRDDFDVWAKQAATLESPDCSCVENLDPIEIPTTGGWYLKSLASVGCSLNVPSSTDNDWTACGFVTNALHDVFGIVYDVSVGGSATAIQPMNASHSEDHMTSCQTFTGDETGSTDSSVSVTTLNRVCHGPSAAFDEIFGAGTYNLKGNGVTWPTDTASPRILAGHDIDWHFRLQPWKTSGSISFSNVWLLFNENSPSHGA